MPSIFSKIISREIPAHILYEDDQVIAFLDISPVQPGHTLVVPKQEKENALDQETSDLAACMVAIKILAPAIIRAMQAEGCVISTNIGTAAGQSVFHTHFHIIPRKSNDHLSSWPNAPVSEDTLDAVAKQIKVEL